jgi:P4 family phage/plasmid primase-like protien
MSKPLVFDLVRCVVFDLEVYPGRWCVGFHGPDPHGQMAIRIIEQRDALERLLDRIAGQERILVGFNSATFDLPLIQAILAGVDPYAPAQSLISSGNLPPALARKRLPDFPCDHIDLSARLRRGGSFPGLKTVAANLGRRVLRELPFDPDKVLTDQEWEEVREYNRVDLEHTWALLERLAPELSALASISSEFDQDLRSVSNPQVVERVFAAEYRRAHGSDPVLVGGWTEVRYKPVDGVQRPRTSDAADWFDKIVNEPIPMVTRGDRSVPSVPAAKFDIGRIKLSVGAGGLHSVDSARVYYSTKRHRLVSVDVSSFYPTLISTKGIAPAAYGETGRETYRSILDRRLEVKAAAKNAEDPEERERLEVQATGLKLIINSTVGKTADPYSTLYDPGAFLAVTLSGQLMLCDLIERLTEAKVRVISANTDGLFLRVPRNHRTWREVLKTWQADTGMKLDVEPLKRVAILASNQYATRGAKDTVKRKGGELRGELDWSHAPRTLVVNDAIASALLFDIPPERTIFECRDPVRFCSVTKRARDALMVMIEGEAETELPKVTRWYHARDSSRLIQMRYDNGRNTTPAGARGVTLCQDLPAEGRPDDLDWAWYLGQARRKIQRLPGYRHRAASRLQGDQAATLVRQAGLLPVPKNGKAQPAGSDAKNPTLLWQWPLYPTVGCYTGPAISTLVVDVDEPEKFRKFVEKDNSPLFGDRWRDLDGALVSVHGEATAEGVRAGRDRGKLIFTFDGGSDHPLCRAKTRWKQSWGVEVFYGNGLPSILGQYGDNGDRYRLDGSLGKAPEWLVAKLSPKIRVKRPKVATLSPEAKELALEGLPAELAAIDPRLADPAIGWRRKDLSDDREIWIGRCPFPHDSGRSEDADLSAGFHDDGPYLWCLHGSCAETQEVNRLLKLRYASKLPVESLNGAPQVEALDARSEAVPPVNQEAIDSLLATYPRTDTGNAERLVARFGHDLRFCHPWKKWLTWDGSRWKVDDTAAIDRMVKKTTRAMFREASYLTDPDDAEAHVKHKSACETRNRREAMRALASSEEGIPILPIQLDANRWLLNVQNGTIDLRTGELRSHRREDLITAQSPISYDRSMPCPLWIKTLDRIMSKNTLMIGFLQRLFGLCLTGDVSEQVLPILYGSGANGKTTILNVMLEMLGPDYAIIAPPGLLMVKRGETHPTERAILFGKRLVVDMESAEGARLNEQFVKQMTGGDMITTRRMREDFWSFWPTHKALLCTNHRPQIQETKDAIWRRIKLTPFKVRIPDAEQDKTLPRRLQAEYPGILAWCVQGCLDWQREGSGEPTEVKDATKGYRNEQDVLGAFLDENTKEDKNSKVRCSDLYARYKRWAEDAKERIITLTAFGLAMNERGFETQKSSSKWYLGVALRDLPTKDEQEKPEDEQKK